jgi:hypothetical protein
MFSIKFLPECGDSTNKQCSDMIIGKIIIGNFTEKFESLTTYWDRKKYQQNWEMGIKRLLNGKTKSCIITSMSPPAQANFIIWWPMYLENDIVFFQNQLLFMNQLKAPFDPEDPYIHLSDRETSIDIHHPISEWTVPIGSLHEFIQLTT